MLRNEKSKRIYLGYFNNDPLFVRLKARGLLLSKNKISDPPVQPERLAARVIEFKKVFFWMHFFDSIRMHRDLIKKSFYNELLTLPFRELYNTLPETAIGLHIRRGDFSKFSQGQKFDREVVLIQTPLEYFVQTIKQLRQLSGKNLKTLVFSDGYESELKTILELPDVQLYRGKSDLEDMLALSKCKVIIPSPSSTFGLFAGFISDAILLHHPDFYMRPIRPDKINVIHFEGPFNYKNNAELSDELRKQIKSLT